MRIVQLAPGAGGGFYCENCIRDAMLLRQLHKLGHEAIALPIYLLGGADQRDIAKGPIFFGGINVWLQQHFGLFRKTPRWLDCWFDWPRLLEKVSEKAGMVSAKELGQTTISMLMGQDGRQVKELDRLLNWLMTPENKPDVVILSDALLLGLAGPIRQRLGCAVVCLLQDEDGFIDGLGEPWTSRVWSLMRQCESEADLFIAVSRYYQSLMIRKLSVESRKVEVVYPGLNPNEYMPAAQKPTKPVIGFLARMCEDNGLDILVDAMAILAGDKAFDSMRLKVCGGKTAADKRYLRTVQEKLQNGRLAERVEWMEDFEMESRKAFLQGISLMCVPFRKPAAYGLCVLEAMACGVGFVEPKMGVFDELAQLSGGGILYEPNTPAALAVALRSLLSSPQTIAEMGYKSRQAVEIHFDIQKTCRLLVELLEGMVRKYT